MREFINTLRPVFYLCGILLTALAATMLLPILIDFVLGETEKAEQDITAFTIAAIVTAYCGLLMVFTNRQPKVTLSIRQTFIFTTLIWLLMPMFGCIPLMISSVELSFTDAFFEAMSGLSTTGATIIIGLDNAPPGLLLWRSLLQWLGGVGIIVMAVAIMPVLQVGGMQLFGTESSDMSEKVMPRINQITGHITTIYTFMTLMCALLYFANGMSGFDAVNHAMTTVATGGFSTHDASLGHYNSFPAISWVATFFMFISGIPFLLYIRLSRGDIGAFGDDGQVTVYIRFVIVTIVGLALFRASVGYGGAEPFLVTLRTTAFNLVSVITGTGYATANYDLWHPMVVAAILFLMCAGGCAGSTTCGIKMFRLQIVYGLALVQMKKLLQPHGVFHPYYNGRKVNSNTVNAILAFLVFYVMSIIITMFAVSAYGYDMKTSLSAAISALSNVGPGLGEIIGPAGTYTSFPDGAKWVLSLGMLLGRLEFFTVLVMLAPTFWRR